MGYEIKNMIIDGIPKIPYRNGSSTYEGVVAHSTATPEAPAVNIRNYESRTWDNAFVHFAVDWNEIIQIADTDYVAWGAGKYANQRFVHVELCETSDPGKFAESYKRFVWVLAKILKDKNLGVSLAGSLWGHYEVSHILGGTDHEDPYDYLASHGISKDQFVQDVKNEYEGSSQSQPQSADWARQLPDNWNDKMIGTLVVAYQGEDGVNIRLGNSFDTSISRVTHYGEGHAVFEQANGMYRVSNGEWITANEKYVAFTPIQHDKKWYVHLPADADTWRIYPIDAAPIRGNERGFLKPRKFGGLEYEILVDRGFTDAHEDWVYEIQTQDFGRVKVYGAPDTGATIYEK